MKNTIKVQRAIHDMTQEQLAKELGVSRQTINFIETGKYLPSSLLAAQIAAYFGTPFEEIFKLEEHEIKRRL